MDIKDVLTDYAKARGVGILRPGASLDAIADVLGPPADADYFPNPKKSWPRTFAYGDVRLEVCRCRRVRYVALSTWTETVDVPTGQPGETRTVVPTTTFADLKEILASAGTDWTLREFPMLRSQFTVIVGEYPVDVQFTFHVPDPDTPDLATLHNAISADLGHICPADA
ncbi:hypothetical protein AB0M39_00660 [Streptomyces sp. NPDC051907]|uniref:hypothetical protein n=1 Tax=Streptomyces sp. NPDC051907 TaxID=3155284 RepID=UPI0034166B11